MTIPIQQVLDLLTSLVDASLVVYEEQPDGTGRYRLLETTRQYAGEKLKATSEEALVRKRHQTFFLALAKEAEPLVMGSEQAIWLERLEREHDNMRAGLEWCSEAEENSETGIRLAAALVWFWHVRGYYSEGRTRLNAALAEGSASDKTQERAWALNGAGLLAFSQGDTASSRAEYLRSQAMFRELGDKEGVALSLNNLGNVAYAEGDYVEMHSLNEESLAIVQALGNQWGIAHTLSNLGLAAFSQGDYMSARSLYEQSLAIFQESGNKWGIAYASASMGNCFIRQGDAASALVRYKMSLAIQYELGDKRTLAYSLDGFAAVASVQKGLKRAARLWGAAESLREKIGAPLSLPERLHHDSQTAQVCAEMDEGAFALAWSEGRAMTLEQAVDYALDESSGESKKERPFT